MKATKIFTVLAMLVLASTMNVNAQWSAVRFDGHNYFTEMFTLSPDTAISSGLESNGISSFLIRTTNGGLSWDSISINTPGINNLIDCIYFVNNNVGYFGGTKNGFQLLMKSNDNGSTWIDFTPVPSSAQTIKAIAFIDEFNGFVATINSIYKTADGGMSWITLSPGIQIYDVKFIDINTGYACGKLLNDAVVYKTTDGGISWNSVLTAPSSTFFSSVMQKIDVISANEAVAMMQYTNALFRTIDGGSNWDTILVPQVFTTQDIDFSDANHGHVLSNMSEIFGTDDGGLTFTLEYAASGGFYGPDVYLNSLSFVGDIGYVCGSNGLIKRHDFSTVGLVHSVDFKDVSTFPNPTFRGDVAMLNGVNVKSNLIIYDLSGKRIKTVLSSNRIQTDDMQCGVYFIQVEGTPIRSKLIVIE